MKFAKVLMRASEDMAGSELETMFLRYKELKKMIKAINKSSTDALSGRDTGEDTGTLSGRATPEPAPVLVPAPAAQAEVVPPTAEQLSEQEVAFIGALNAEVSKFNAFFEELEEDAVIRLQALTDELAAVTSSGAGDVKALAELKARLVDFHGSCVLSLHWSLLNYGAINKILKKHDKRTGVLLRAPCLGNVLAQPFNSTSIMSRLVKQAEELMEAAMGIKAADSGSGASGGGVTGTLRATPNSPAAAGTASEGAQRMAGAAAQPAVSTAATGSVAAAGPSPATCAEAGVGVAGGSGAGALSPRPTAGAPRSLQPGQQHNHHHHLSAVLASHRSKMGELSKRTRAALDTWEALRTNVSTPSTFPAALAGGAHDAGEPSFTRTSITSYTCPTGSTGAAGAPSGLQQAGKRMTHELSGEHAAKRVRTASTDA